MLPHPHPDSQTLRGRHDDDHQVAHDLDDDDGPNALADEIMTLTKLTNIFYNFFYWPQVGKYVER